MELLRYMVGNVVKRPMRALFIIVSGFLSALVLVFSFALGTKVTSHIRTDTIAKWTGHLWVSPKQDFQFAEEETARYAEEAAAVRDYLSRNSNTAILAPWIVTFSEIQVGTSRQYLGVTATDLQLDTPYREHTELVEGRFPNPDEQYTALVTTVIAQKYGLRTGDSITCFIPSAYGARNAMDFTITGIFRASAPWYDDTITIGAQDYITMSELGDAFPFYKAYVKDEKGIAQMVKELAPKAPDFQVKGYHDDDFVRFLLSLGATDIFFFGFMAMIIFLALLIGIRSIILTNIFDRRDEIGTLRALGFPRGTVRNLFFGESLASLLIGYILGAGTVAVMGAYFQARIVRPPLMMLQYMFGMTRMAITFDAFTAGAPLLLLLAVLFLTTFRTVGRETEKQAAMQMANR